MCGRFVIAADATALQAAFGLTSTPDFTPRYNIAPTQLAPVILNSAPNTMELVRWGLIPSWSKDESMGARLINARSEGVDEKPSFRSAFKRRRCLVPATGFYEWKAEGGKKTPMYIHLPDEPIFALAGLWEVWHDVKTFTILTMAANAFMRPLHERMPVILDRSDYDLWLRDEDVPADVLRSALRGAAPERMDAYAVSTSVNRPANDSPELIEPLAS